MKTVDKIIGKIALPIIVLAGVVLIFVTVLSSKGTSKENNGYIRVINCVISIPATSRTQSDIETCYKTVEHDLGIHLQRYDTNPTKK